VVCGTLRAGGGAFRPFGGGFGILRGGASVVVVVVVVVVVGGGGGTFPFVSCWTTSCSSC